MFISIVPVVICLVGLLSAHVVSVGR